MADPGLLSFRLGVRYARIQRGWIRWHGQIVQRIWVKRGHGWESGDVALHPPMVAWSAVRLEKKLAAWAHENGVVVGDGDT